ncbi:MAG: AsmA-like C-terminal domain-containing protein [Pirellulales bacterium]|nr:AsmA-like C-terminal domain-containing protein [Pirellulales bacterium]
MPLIKDLINFCWFFFKWGIVPGTIVALLVIPHLYQRVDEEIRCQIERRFAEHYPNLKITVRSAVRVEGQGIEVRDLSIREPGAKDPRDTMLHLERVFLRCDTDLAELIGDNVCVNHVTIQRPTLRVARLPDGSWTTSRLWPPPQFNKVPPDVTVDNGTIEIVDLSKTPPSTMTFPNVNLTIQNKPRPVGDPSAPLVRMVRGNLTCNHCGKVEFEGEGNAERQDWRLAGTIHDLEIVPNLREALPAPLARQLAVLGGLRGSVELKFAVKSDSTAPSGCRFTLSGQLAEGHLDNDPRLPDRLTNLRGSFKVDNEGLAVENVTAQAGPSTLRIARGRLGFGPQAPWSVTAMIDQLVLDERLPPFLPDSMKAVWRKYQPAGRIDLAVDLKSDGRQLDAAHAKIIAQCQDVAFAYHKFRYRMEQGRGQLKIDHDELAIDMIANAAGQPVRMTGRVKQPLSAPHGWFEAHGKDIPVDMKDDNLLGALNEETRSIVKLLEPRGLCDFRIRVWREQPEGEFFRHLVLDPKDSAICFEKFPYPLERIYGRIERFPDGRWELRDLHGTNDTAQIWCNGQLTNGPDGKQLTLRLVGKDVPLDNKLRKSLKESMQQAWDNLDPRGMIDVQTDITWSVDRKKLDMVVVAQPQPDTASIRPRMFPCQMEKLHGVLVYRDGHVTFDKFRARHDRTTISGRGHWDFLPDGSWDFHLENVSVDRLRLDNDRELKLALPQRLREGVAKLDPSGPMYLHKGKLDVHHSGVTGDPIKATWDLWLGFHSTQIDSGIQLENMHGEVSLRGASDGKSFYSQGELDIDSLTFRDFQFTDVKGPFWIDDGRILLGSWVARREQNPNGSPTTEPRAISARLFGGTVKADAWIAPKYVPCYGLTAELLGADLAQFAKETMPGQQQLQGRVGLVLNLKGLAPKLHGLRGDGRLWLHEGDVYNLPPLIIYDLPVMSELLTLLKVPEPDTTAFTEADLRFRVAGNHVYLDHIELNGNTISLVGKGQMDFQSNIGLEFHALVGRNQWQIPLVSPLMGEASRQAMTINVAGTLHNPNVSRDVLPGVKEAIRELEASLQAMPTGAPTRPVAGRVPPSVNPNPLRR